MSLQDVEYALTTARTKGVGIISDGNAAFDKADKLVSMFAAAAAAAMLLSGLLPVVSNVTALAVSGVFIWTMYIKINASIGLKIEKRVLKTIVSGVLSNIASNIVGLLAAAVIAGFFPGAGSLVWAGLIFGVVYLAGMTYVAVIKKLCRNGFDPNISPDVIKRSLDSELSHTNIQSAVKSASNEYKSGYKSGKYTGKETVETETGWNT